MLEWYDDTLIRRYIDTLIPWFIDTMIQQYDDTMTGEWRWVSHFPWRGATLLLFAAARIANWRELFRFQNWELWKLLRIVENRKLARIKKRKRWSLSLPFYFQPVPVHAGFAWDLLVGDFWNYCIPHHFVERFWSYVVQSLGFSKVNPPTHDLNLLRFDAHVVHT